MDNNNLENYTYKSTSNSVIIEETTFISKVYMWMCGALLITGVTAYFAATESFITFLFGKSSFLFYALIIGEFILVISLSSAIHKMSTALASSLFLFYSFINGITLSVIFIVYTQTSIATTFFITAGTFGIMSAIGYFTKTDLTKIGKMLIMALIGVVIASVVNIFLGNSMLDLIISIIGVLVFVGLIAYDTQKIKNLGIYLNNTENSDDSITKYSILGALSLYLDFINLFIFLLRFLGRRK